MDFSTLGSPETSPEAALKCAIAVTLMAQDQHLIQRESQATDTSRHPRAGDAASRWPGGMHSHPYPEICIPLTPGAAIDLEHGRFDFHPPSLALIRPHVMHCEAYMRKSKRYCVLWMSFSGSAVLAQVVRYRRQHGWDRLYRWALPHPAGLQIYRRLSSERESIPRDLESFRANAIMLLAEVLKRAMRGVVSQARPLSCLEKHINLLERLQTFIDNHYHQNNVSVPLLAASAGVSPNYLNYMFKQWSGESIHLGIMRRRMEKALELCQRGDLLVKQIAQQVGYEDPLYFSRAFRRFHGVSPMQAIFHGSPRQASPSRNPASGIQRP